MRATAIAFFAFLVLFSTPVIPQNGAIGIYADAYRSCDAVKVPAPIYYFSMWVWCHPGSDGQKCAEFSIDYPANIIPTQVVWNDQLISVVLGDLESGVSVCYEDCQYEWNWPCYQYVYATSLEVSMISIAAHPDVGAYQFANCLEGFPVEPVYLWGYLSINQPGA